MIFSRLINTVVERIVERVDARLHQALKGVADDVRTVAERQKKLEKATKELAEGQVAMRMQLGSGGTPRRGRQKLSGQTVPLTVAEIARPEVQAPSRDVQLTPIDRCPACATTERTLVCEYNKAVATGIDIEEPMRRYDYSMCHGCGLTYTTLRPMGDAYRYLFSRFDESLGRYDKPGRVNPLLSPLPLTDDQREDLRRRMAPGPLVSEHLDLRASAFIPQLLTDRLANSAHIEIIGSLLPLKQPKVLEIRPRFGSIAGGLRRLYGAEAVAMSMTDAQAFVTREVYGIDGSSLIDFENFTIPFDTKFDLIVAAHMFTHVLKPEAFFAELRRHLAPGGHIYLHKEPDDTDFLDGPMWMFNSMNPFHMQVFDGRTLTRVLGLYGFEPVFVGHHRGTLIYLGRMAATPIQPVFRDKERRARLAAYERARDAAILRLPEHERWRYAGEWERVVERAVATGVAEFDQQAKLRIVRQGS